MGAIVAAEATATKAGAAERTRERRASRSYQRERNAPLVAALSALALRGGALRSPGPYLHTLIHQRPRSGVLGSSAILTSSLHWAQALRWGAWGKEVAL